MTTQHPAFTDVTTQTYVPKTLNKTDSTVVGDVVPFQAFDTGVTVADRSGTITAANAPQQLMAANALRRGFDLQAVSGDIYFRKDGGDAGVAGTASYLLTQGSLYEAPISGCSVAKISVISATLGAKFSSSEW